MDFMVPSTLHTNSQAFISMCPINAAWMVQSKKWEVCVKTQGEGEGSVINSDVYLCNPRVRRGELRVRACSISTAHYATFGSPSASSSD